MLLVLAGCNAAPTANDGHHGALVTHVTMRMCIPASRGRLDSKSLYGMGRAVLRHLTGFPLHSEKYKDIFKV